MSSTDELIRQYEARLAAFEARLQKIEGSCLAELSQERHKAVYGNEKPILEKFETF